MNQLRPVHKGCWLVSHAVAGVINESLHSEGLEAEPV